MFITGFAAVTLKASREAPRAKVLSKPFHLKDLVLEVERMFEDRAPRRSALTPLALARAARALDGRACRDGAGV